MSKSERILHSILFEVIALTIVIPMGVLLTDKPLGIMAGSIVGVALIAMVWNYIYNLGFDRIFGENRLSRRWKLRVGHGVGFEVGLLLATVPFLMWRLNMDFWSVLILDMSLVFFFLVYAIVFNWVYGNLRASFRVAGRLSGVKH